MCVREECVVEVAKEIERLEWHGDRSGAELRGKELPVSLEL